MRQLPLVLSLCALCAAFYNASWAYMHLPAKREPKITALSDPGKIDFSWGAAGAPRIWFSFSDRGVTPGGIAGSEVPWALISGDLWWLIGDAAHYFDDPRWTWKPGPWREGVAIDVGRG